jgi:uncharacterized membrane protein YkoI
MANISSLVALTASLVMSTAAVSAQQPTVKEEKPGLLAQAKIKPEDARRTALAKVPMGRIKSAEIEMEKDKLVYSFDIKVPKKSGVEEVLVDALTGDVVSVEHESAAAEKKEQAQEAKEKKEQHKKPPQD